LRPGTSYLAKGLLEDGFYLPEQRGIWSSASQSDDAHFIHQKSYRDRFQPKRLSEYVRRIHGHRVGHVELLRVWPHRARPLDIDCNRQQFKIGSEVLLVKLLPDRQLIATA
jgi:hypothetical protein